MLCDGDSNDVLTNCVALMLHHIKQLGMHIKAHMGNLVNKFQCQKLLDYYVVSLDNRVKLPNNLCS